MSLLIKLFYFILLLFNQTMKVIWKQNQVRSNLISSSSGSSYSSSQRSYHSLWLSFSLSSFLLFAFNYSFPFCLKKAKLKEINVLDIIRLRSHRLWVDVALFLISIKLDILTINLVRFEFWYLFSIWINVAWLKGM